MKIAMFDLRASADEKVAQCDEIANDLLAQIREANASDEVLKTLVLGVVNMILLDQTLRYSTLDKIQQLDHIRPIIAAIGSVVGIRIEGVADPARLN